MRQVLSAPARRTPRILATVAAQLMLLLWSGCGGKHSEFILLLPETRALEAGTAVYLNDEAVGEVLGSDPRPEIVEGERRSVLEVRIRIDRRYADLVTEDSKVEVRKVPPVVGSRRVVIEPGQGTTARPGSTLRGRDATWTWSRVREWKDELSGMVTNEEVRQRFSEFADDAREVARRGRAEWERRAPELRARADALVEQAREHGPKVAQWLREQLDAILQALDRGEEPDAEDDSGPM